MLVPGWCFISCTKYRIAAAQLRDVYSKSFNTSQLLARAGVLLFVSGPGASIESFGGSS